MLSANDIIKAFWYLLKEHESDISLEICQQQKSKLEKNKKPLPMSAHFKSTLRYCI